jgi:hypothetical protein
MAKTIETPAEINLDEVVEESAMAERIKKAAQAELDKWDQEAIERTQQAEEVEVEL